MHVIKFIRDTLATIFMGIFEYNVFVFSFVTFNILICTDFVICHMTDISNVLK